MVVLFDASCLCSVYERHDAAKMATMRQRFQGRLELQVLTLRHVALVIKFLKLSMIFRAWSLRPKRKYVRQQVGHIA